MPVISNETVGASDCIIDEVTGYLYEAQNIHSLADKINRFIKSPELAETMGNKAREITKSKCSVDAFASFIEQLAGFKKT